MIKQLLLAAASLCLAGNTAAFAYPATPIRQSSSLTRTTPATRMEDAIVAARKSLTGSSSVDPTTPLNARYEPAAPKRSPKQQNFIPPPPPISYAPISKRNGHKNHNGFVDPPPAVPATGMINGFGLAQNYYSQAVYVKEKVRLADQVKVVAVMDGRAVLSLPAGLRAEHNWPNTVTIAAGERFDSFDVLAVQQDSVTFEEDHKRSVKSLEPLH